MSMKQVYRGLGVCAALVSWSAQADVMDEYRDPAFQKGYVVTEYLFDNNPEQKQDSLSVYGEYDAHEYATIYVRLQGARIKNKIVGGMRASIYNSMPEEGVDALIDFMREFERTYG